jgi:hypothetical protein
VRPLSDGKRLLMRAVQESAMQDTAIHLIRTATDSTFGDETVTYEDGETYACGFDPTGGDDRDLNASGRSATETEVVISDARLRLPLEALPAISPHDRFRVTHRYGEALDTPQTFDVLGYPQPGPSGVLVELRRVEK